MAGTYEAFLSFRGKDTRQGFTDYLYHDLVSAGVNTFRDDDELRAGEEIGPELMKAITNSKISIPIFSKKYAESKWCLRELSLIVERKQNYGQKIIPIFYDVDPWEVKNYRRGSYYESFLRFEKEASLDQNTVQQWKNALAVVGELKGLELKKETNRLEGSFVKKIVQKVLLELKKGQLNLPKYLVGIDHHVEKLNELLRSNDPNGVKMIGILGMSGVGKTTIAKTIFNQLYESFDSHCFLDDVRAKLQRGDGLLNLQKQLLRKILKRNNLDVDDVDDGIVKIKNAVHNKKVFLVLDNVDDMSKIEGLLVLNHSFYGGGSRIIITTTNEEVLLAIKVQCERDGKFDVYYKYEPRLMGKEDALMLFSKWAFNRESPPNDYLDLTKEVIAHAGGLPLVLETLGSLLSIEKNKVYWKETLKMLHGVPPTEVVEKLKIRYDAMDFGQKQIFLDIACYFVGHNVTIPSYIWKACGFHASEGIRTLERRSLIKFITEKGIHVMHCEGCARKVRCCLKGVEDVQTDCKTRKVAVKGEKSDPLKLLQRVLQRKSRPQVELLSSIPKPPAQEPKAEEKEPPKPPEDKKEPQVITVVLKVNIHCHCEGCAREIKKCFQKMKGVEKADPDLQSSQVTVKGVFDPPRLVDYVYKRTGKHAVIVKLEPEKKDSNKKETEEKKVEEQAANIKELDQLAKLTVMAPADPPVPVEKKAEEKEESTKMPDPPAKLTAMAPAKLTAPVDLPAVFVEKKVEEKEESEMVEMKNKFQYLNPHEYQKFQLLNLHEYQIPLNEFMIDAPPPPSVVNQRFSEENPNACSVM